MKKLGLAMFLAAICLAFGCAKKQVKSEPAPQPVAVKDTRPTKPVPVVLPPKKEEPQVKTPTAMELYAQRYAKLPKTHKVVKGECLWWIAEYKQIYNDPFMWPLIYKANRDQIKNPDLIYPNQVFTIPREFSLQELKASRKMAGAPRPYLPPKDANLPVNLRQELGWSF